MADCLGGYKQIERVGIKANKYTSKRAKEAIELDKIKSVPIEPLR